MSGVKSKKLELVLPSNKRWWLFNPFTLGAIITALLFLVLYVSSGQITIGQRGAFERYLKEKYGKVFVVEKVRVEGGGIAMPGTPVANAYPVDASDIRFKVWNRGGLISGNYAYSDDYATRYWSEQGKNLIEEKLHGNIPNIESIEFTISGGVAQDFTSLDNYPYKGSTPDINKVLREQPGRLNVAVYVRAGTISSKAEPSTMQLENAFKVVEAAKELGITSGSVGYGYTSQDYTEKNQYGTPILRYTISVDAAKLQAISQPDQLQAYFKDRTKE